jgi:hypothetical protein
MNMKKQSKSLVVSGLLCFLAGGAAWFFLAILTVDYGHLAVPVAAALAALGGFLMILNAVINPESIPRPEIPQPQINLPHEMGKHTNLNITNPHIRVNANVPGIINVNEWPIVRIFNKDSKPITARQQVRGTLCCLLWIATVAVYLPLSFYMNNFEISWIMFLGTAVIHTLVYSLFSIGESRPSKVGDMSNV